MGLLPVSPPPSSVGAHNSKFRRLLFKCQSCRTFLSPRLLIWSITSVPPIWFFGQFGTSSRRKQRKCTPLSFWTLQFASELPAAEIRWAGCLSDDGGRFGSTLRPTSPARDVERDPHHCTAVHVYCVAMPEALPGWVYYAGGSGAHPETNSYRKLWITTNTPQIQISTDKPKYLTGEDEQQLHEAHLLATFGHFKPFLATLGQLSTSYQHIW